MLAAVLHGKEQLRLEPVIVPPVGPNDILVKVQVALTCGTDLKVFRRGYHARMIKPPAVLGHELAGDVVEVGSEVTAFRPGQRVVAANSAPCRDCFHCRRNNENLCEDLLFNNGAYAIPGLAQDLPRDALRAIFETNLFGQFDLINRLMPTFRAQGHGRVVNNSSVLGLIALARKPASIGAAG